MTVYQRFVPAPTKGLNYAQPAGDGDPATAILLQNMACRPRGLTVMPAMTAMVAASAANIRTIAAVPVTGADEIWVSRDTGLCQVTGIVGAPAIALTTGFGSWLNTSTAAARYTFFFNGTDNPKVYTGGAWANSLLTGPVPSSDFNQAIMFRGRMYLLSNNRLGFWYAAAGAITGATTFYDMGTLARRGGSAVAISTFSTDNADGPDDYLAVYTSKGELVLFSGNDPSATTWSPIAVLYVGEPSSVTPNKEALCAFGDELLAFTRFGIQSVRSVLAKGLIGPTFSEAIDIGIFAELGRSSADLGKLFFLKSINLLVAVAKDTTFMMDTVTKGWSTWGTGTNAANPVYFAEPGSSGVDVYMLKGAATIVYRLSHNTATTEALEAVTWPSRMKDLNPEMPLQVRGWAASEFRDAFTIGLLADCAGVPSTASITNTSTDWQPARLFNYPYAAANGGYVSKVWKTIASPPGDNTALSFSATLQAQSYNFSFLGWDLRSEQAGTGGP